MALRWISPNKSILVEPPVLFKAAGDVLFPSLSLRPAFSFHTLRKPSWVGHPEKIYHGVAGYSVFLIVFHQPSSRQVSLTGESCPCLRDQLQTSLVCSLARLREKAAASLRVVLDFLSLFLQVGENVCLSRPGGSTFASRSFPTFSSFTSPDDLSTRRSLLCIFWQSIQMRKEKVLLFASNSPVFPSCITLYFCRHTSDFFPGSVLPQPQFPLVFAGLLQ